MASKKDGVPVDPAAPAVGAVELEFEACVLEDAADYAIMVRTAYLTVAANIASRMATTALRDADRARLALEAVRAVRLRPNSPRALTGPA